MSSNPNHRVDLKLMRSLKVHLRRIDAPPLTSNISAGRSAVKLRISLTKMRSLKVDIKRLQNLPKSGRVRIGDVSEDVVKELSMPVLPIEGLPQKLYTCKVCGKIFKHNSSMWRHKRTHASAVVDSAPDLTDSTSFKPSSEPHDPPPSKLFSCPRCDEKFTKKSDIIIHVQAHYDDLSRIKKESYVPKNSYSTDMVPPTSGTDNVSVKQEPGIEAGPVFSNFNEYDEDMPVLKEECPQPSGSGKVYQCKYCPKVLEALQPLREHVIRDHPHHAAYYMRHTCGICGATFHNKNKLSLHSRIHTGGSVFSCQFCESFFCSMWNLRNHVKKAHPEHVDTQLVVSSCEVCGEEFDNLYKLKVHKRIHSGETLFPCKYCDVSFLGPRSRRCHVRRKHPEHCNEVANCEVCGVEFQNAYKLKLHSRVHSGGKLYPCEHCTSVFTTSFVLRAHMKKRHPESDLTIFPCEECGQKFENEYKLKLHSRVHEGGKIFNCEFCDSFYTNNYNLKCHMTSQHPEHNPEPKPSPDSNHTCDTCGITFENNFKLKLHRRIHTDKSILSCTICHLGFSNSNSLRVHIKNIHPGQPWATPRLPRPRIRKPAHKSQVLAKRHKLQLHMRRSVPLTGNRYLCKLCPSNYSQVYLLRAHMKKMHPDHGPTYFMWPCGVCGLEFQNRFKLKLHSRIHSTAASSGNIFPCRLCASSFIGIHNLQSHMKNVHPDPNASATKRIHRMTTRQKFENVVYTTPEKVHNCQLCGVTFDFELRLNQHIRAEHSEHVTSCVDREDSPQRETLTEKLLNGPKDQVTSAIEEYLSLVEQYIYVNLSIIQEETENDSTGYPESNLTNDTQVLSNDKSEHSNLTNGDAEDDPLSIETASSDNSQASVAGVNGNRINIQIFKNGTFNSSSGPSLNGVIQDVPLD